MEMNIHRIKNVKIGEWKRLNENVDVQDIEIVNYEFIDDKFIPTKNILTLFKYKRIE